MQFSTLRNSFSISISFDADKAADVAAIAVGKAVRNATKYVLDRAIADSRTVIGTGHKARQVADAIAHSTTIRVEAVVEDRIVAPMVKAKTAIVSPVTKAFDVVNDAVIDYLEATPVKAASVVESLPTPDTFDFEASLANVRDEIATQNEINASSFSEDWGHKAVEAAKRGHVLVGDQVITEEGINAPVTKEVKEVKPKASTLSGMIREEAAKH